MRYIIIKRQIRQERDTIKKIIMYSLLKIKKKLSIKQ